MRVTSTSHPNDLKAAESFRETSIDIIQAAGATAVQADPVGDAHGGPHARRHLSYGERSQDFWVVDKYHRAHDVPNLFIVDGSSFVTGGRNHPAVTIQALAFRAADFLIKSAKSGEVVATWAAGGFR